MSERSSFLFRPFATAVIALSVVACASKVLKHDEAETITVIEEYDRAVQIEELPADAAGPSGSAPSATPTPAPDTGPDKSGAGKKPDPNDAKKTAKPPNDGKTANKKSDKAGGKKPGKTKEIVSTVADKVAENVVPPREPELEDSEGFSGRRPEKNPYWVGERVTLEVSYFGVVAGDMTLEVRNYAAVNGRKAYRFVSTAKSTSVFAMFYAVDDWAETFVDVENLTPFNYSLHVKETKQLREVRSFFDWTNMTGKVWDKRITKEKGVEEKNYEWQILPYSQNVFSAPFYLRAFTLTPGKKVNYRVGHEGKNIVVTGEVLRKEKISTLLGEMNTVVVKPRIEIDGVFKPVGDIYFWMTDDDRKFIVKIESKIKIGKIVGSVKAIDKGAP